MPKKNEIAEASDADSPVTSEDTIRARAYQLFEQRGCEYGHDLDDWLLAEAELTGKKPVASTDQETTAHKAAA